LIKWHTTASLGMKINNHYGKESVATLKIVSFYWWKVIILHN